MDIGTLVLIGIGIVVVLAAVIILDLLFAGGAMTTLAPALARSASAGVGTMHGMAMTPALATSASAGASMVSNPIGQGILLALLTILGVLAAGAVFFR